MKRIVFLDLDGTLSKGYLSLQFLHYLAEQGIFDADEYSRQMQFIKDFKEGRMSFRQWVHTMTGWGAGLRGKTAAEVREHALGFFEKHRGNIYDSSYELIALLKENGFEPVLVSAGVHEIVSLAAEALGIRHVMSTELEINQSGYYSGKIITTIHLPEGKMEGVQKMLNRYGVNSGQCAGLGDSPHDEPMLAALGHPMALNPNDGLEHIAKKRGWPSLTHKTIVPHVRQWLETLE